LIQATRLNGLSVVINADLIKFVEATPDTLITLTTGEKIMVREPVELIAARVTEYRHRLCSEASGTGVEPPAGDQVPADGELAGP